MQVWLCCVSDKIDVACFWDLWKPIVLKSKYVTVKTLPKESANEFWLLYFEVCTHLPNQTTAFKKQFMNTGISHFIAFVFLYKALGFYFWQKLQHCNLFPIYIGCIKSCLIHPAYYEWKKIIRICSLHSAGTLYFLQYHFRWLSFIRKKERCTKFSLWNQFCNNFNGTMAFFELYILIHWNHSMCVFHHKLNSIPKVTNSRLVLHTSTHIEMLTLPSFVTVNLFKCDTQFLHTFISVFSVLLYKRLHASSV